MEIHRDDKKKIIEVWLTQQEAADESLQSRLKPIYAQWKRQKYLVAVYRSGKENLFRSTLELLAYNKKRCAQLAVEREKTQKTQKASQMEL